MGPVFLSYKSLKDWVPWIIKWKAYMLPQSLWDPLLIDEKNSISHVTKTLHYSTAWGFPYIFYWIRVFWGIKSGPYTRKNMWEIGRPAITSYTKMTGRLFSFWWWGDAHVFSYCCNDGSHCDEALPCSCRSASASSCQATMKSPNLRWYCNRIYNWNLRSWLKKFGTFWFGYILTYIMFHCLSCCHLIIHKTKGGKLKRGYV